MNKSGFFLTVRFSLAFVVMQDHYKPPPGTNRNVLPDMDGHEENRRAFYQVEDLAAAQQLTVLLDEHFKKAAQDDPQPPNMQPVRPAFGFLASESMQPREYHDALLSVQAVAEYRPNKVNRARTSWWESDWKTSWSDAEMLVTSNLSGQEQLDHLLAWLHRLAASLEPKLPRDAVRKLRARWSAKALGQLVGDDRHDREERELENLCRAVGIDVPARGLARDLWWITVSPHREALTARIAGKRNQDDKIIADLVRKMAEIVPAAGEPAGATPKAASRRGRKKLSPEESKRRQGILERWERASEAGVTRKRFCDDEDITSRELQNYQDWARQRENRQQ